MWLIYDAYKSLDFGVPKRVEYGIKCDRGDQRKHDWILDPKHAKRFMFVHCEPSMTHCYTHKHRELVLQYQENMNIQNKSRSEI